MKTDLQTHFDNLGLTPQASQWLLDVWDAIQLFDDVADKDDIERKDLDRVIYSAFVGFNQNQFFSENYHSLNGLLNVALVKWQASDTAERTGKANEKSFVWRASYYDLVVYCTILCQGYEFAHKNSQYLMDMYGEDYKDYIKEFKNA